MMGYRQVGKASDFDSDIPRFKSWYPIHFLKKAALEAAFFISDIGYLDIGYQLSNSIFDFRYPIREPISKARENFPSLYI